MDFSDIIGHDKIINSLKNTIKNDTIAHGYLFKGPKTIGKTMVGLAFSKTLLCRKKGLEPCNVCKSCIQFDSNNHPDLHIEEPEGDSFKKEQIDEIQKEIRKLPYEGDRKIFILKSADTMTTQAQNSFLKTLEEPPKDTIIIMTAINDRNILPTIRSRSQILKFSPVDKKVIEEFLVNRYNIDKNKAHMISSFSSGVVGRAKEICESEEFNDIREGLINIIKNNISNDSFKSFTTSKFFEENKDKINDILDIMLTWFRDLLIYKQTSNGELLINKDKVDLLTEQAFKLSTDKIHDIIDNIIETKDNISSNVNFQLSIELMLLNLQEG